jgi:hypothetical protein
VLEADHCRHAVVRSGTPPRPLNGAATLRCSPDGYAGDPPNPDGHQLEAVASIDAHQGDFDVLVALSEKLWAEVPALIRKDVEQHVLAHLPGDLQARGIPIDSDPAFFHFGGGMAVRNLCREQLTDDELAAYCPFGGGSDMCYIGVLAATPVRTQAPISRPQPRQLQFSFIEAEL